MASILPEVSEVTGREAKSLMLTFGNQKIWRGGRWIDFGMKYSSEIDDPIKKAANNTSADNIAGSILYINKQYRK